MARRWSTALLVLLLVAPVAMAQEDAPRLPCLDLDVALGDLLAGETHPESCAPQEVGFVWNGSPAEGWGEVALRARVIVPLVNPLGCVPAPDAQLLLFELNDRQCAISYGIQSAGDPEVFDASGWGTLSRWMGSGAHDEEDAPAEVIHASIVLHARFRIAARLSDCDGARGDFEAVVNDRAVASGAPGELFASLCRLASTGALETRVAGIAGVLLDALARDAPSLAPHLDPVRTAFAALAVLPRADPAAAGDATAVLAPRGGSAQAEGGVEADAGVHASVGAALAIGPPALGTASSPRLLERAMGAAEPSHAPILTRQVSIAPKAPSIHPDASTRALPTAPGAPAPVSVREAQAQSLVAHVEEAPVVDLLRVGALALLGFALYQRFRRPAALDHPLRAALCSACAKLGRGAGARELGEMVGVGRTTAEYHLTYLSRLGILRIDRGPAGRRLFAAPAMKPPAPEAPLAQRVLDLVRARREVPLSAIVRVLDVTRFRADRCVKDLLLEGKLASRWTDEGRLYFMPGP